MKTTCNLLVGILISLFWGSCASEEAGPEYPDKGKSVFYIYANSGSVDTRTVMDGSGAIQWLANDRINVNGIVNTETNIGWDGGTGTRFGFATEPTAESGYYYAVYPAVATDGTSNVWQPGGAKFRVKMPQEQSYKDGISFADNVNLSVAYGETNQLLFYNVGGVVKVTIAAASMNVFYEVKKIRFVSNPGKPVSGTGTVDAITTKLTLDQGQSETVDLVFDTPQTFAYFAPLSFLWCLPVNKYEAGWKIQVFDESGVLIGATTGKGELNVQRTKITPLNTIRVEKTKYKINFRESAGAMPEEPHDKFVGVDLKILPSITRTRPGYIFLGWALTPDATSPQFHKGDTVNDVQLGFSGGDVDLYAVWKVSFFDCHENGRVPDGADSRLRLPMIYVSGSGSSAKLMLTGTLTNTSALFQFGSVIAWNTSTNVLYNPSLSGSSTWNSSWMPIKDVEHTNDGLKAAAGDPCRLVGMTVSEIQTALKAGQTPDNGIWRLPTKDENYRDAQPSRFLGVYLGVPGVGIGVEQRFFPIYPSYIKEDGVYNTSNWWHGGWSSTTTNEYGGNAFCLQSTYGFGFSPRSYTLPTCALSVRCVRQ